MSSSNNVVRFSAGKSGTSRRLLSTTSAAAIMMALAVQPALADNWVDLDTTGGSTVTDLSTANTTNIDVTSNRAIVEGDLDITKNWTVNVNGDLVAIDRENDPTYIYGRLNCSGSCHVLDGDGFIVGESAVVDSNSVTFATGDLLNAQNYLETGRLEIGNFSNDASILIEEGASISVAEAGLAAFVSPTVVNNGVINAKMGKVAFAAGEKVTLDLYGDGLVEVEVSGELADAYIEHSGEIDAEGGVVQMTALAAKDAVDNIINVEGVITVASAEVKGGKIILSGGDSGTVSVAGTLNASGTNEAGSVDVKGQNIDVAASAELLADSADVAGSVKVIADDALSVAGTISAQGQNKTGFVDTSAKNVDFVSGASILAGHWLIDPINITIGAADEALYESQLAGGDLTITTDQAGGDPGNLSLEVVLDWSSASVLSLFANDTLTVTAAGGVDATGGGSVVFTADDVVLGGSVNADSVTFDRATDGTISLAGAGGAGLSLDTSELDLITANRLQIGKENAADNNVSAVWFYDDYDYSVNIAELLSLNALADSSSYVSMEFDQTAAAFDVNANDGVEFVGDVAMTSTVGDISMDTNADAAVSGSDDFHVYFGDITNLTSAGDISIVADAYNVDGTANLNAKGGAGTINFARSTDGSVGVGDGATGDLNFSNAELATMNAAELNIGGDVTPHVTAMNVADADVDHIETVNLNALVADSEISFEGDSVFDNVNADAAAGIDVTGTITTQGGDIVLETQSTSFNQQILIASTGSVVSNDGDITLNSNGSSGGFTTVYGNVDAGSGDIDVNARQFKLNGTSTVSADELHVEGSAVTQNVNSVVTANVLTGSLASTASFGGANLITKIGYFETGTAGWSDGGFTLNNVSGSTLKVNGALSSNGGDITLTNNSRVAVKALGSIVSNDGNIVLNANGDDSIRIKGLINAGAGDTALNAEKNVVLVDGSTVETTGLSIDARVFKQESGSQIVATLLEGTLSRYAELLGSTNAIDAIGGFSTGVASTYDGGFTLVDNGGLEIIGELSTQGGAIDIDGNGTTWGEMLSLEASGSIVSHGGNVTLASDNGGLIIKGAIDTAAGDVDLSGTQVQLKYASTLIANALNFDTGRVYQDTTSAITVDVLSGVSQSDVVLQGTGNDVATLNDIETGAGNWSNGGFTLVDANGLNIAGELSTSGTAHDVAYGDGAILIGTQGGDLVFENTANVDTDGGALSVSSDSAIDVDLGAAIDLADGAAFFDASTVYLGDDIVTTGAVTGTASLVEVENTDAQIQDGVYVAAAGAEVEIASGTFSEGDIVIDKNMRISGVSKNSTIIDATGYTDGFLIDSDLGNTNVILRRMSVDNATGTGVRVADTANLKVLQINQMSFSDNGYNGVAVYGNSLTKFNVVNSDFFNNGATGGSGGEGDILAYLYNGDITLRNISIENNTASNTADYGIQIRGADTLAASGVITLDNVSVAGDYRAALLGIQRYDGVDVTFTDVALGGQTALGTNSSGWGALYLSELGGQNVDIGETSFGAIDTQYIALGSEAGSPDVDARDAIFEGVIGRDADLDESFAIEAQVKHDMDEVGAGHVTWLDSTDLFVTENSLGIQNAIDLASAGITVNVGAGTYIEDITVDKALKLAGYDAILKSDGGANLITVTASNVDIDPFTFDGAGSADYGIYATGAGAIGLISDANTFKNFNTAGIYVSSTSAGLGTLTGNIFEGSSTAGIELGTLSGGYQLDIIGNQIGSNGDSVVFGIKSASIADALVNLTNGSIDSSGDAIQINGSINSPSTVTLTNVDIESGDEAVDINGNLYGTLNVDGGSLIAVGSGIESGSLYGAIDVSNGATIEGNSASSGQGINILGTVYGSLDVDGSSVSGGVNGIGHDGGEIDVNGGSVSITDSTISGTNGSGVALGDLSNSAVVTINANVSITGGQDAVFIDDITDSTVYIQSNTSLIGDDDGIDFDGEINNSSVTVSANGLIQGGDEGIDVSDIVNGSTFSITGNTGAITGVSDNGISFDGADSSTVTITGNAEINGQGLDGIYMDQDFVDTTLLISGNTLITGGDDAIDIDGVDGGSVTISLNDLIEGVGSDGIEFDSTVDGATVNVYDNGKILAGDDGIEFQSGISDSAVTISFNDNIQAGRNGILINGELSNDVSVEIKKNRIRQATTGSGISISDSTFGGINSLNILENSVWKAGVDGIYVSGAANASVTDNNIGYYGPGHTPVGGTNVIAGNGIAITESSDVIVTGNYVTKTGEDGIDISDSDGAEIYSNVVSVATDNAISVSGGASVKVYTNNVSDSATGIAADGALNLWIRDNDITDTTDYGIYLSDNDGTNFSNDADIWENTITLNNDTAIGIYVENSDYVTIGSYNNPYAASGLDGGNVIDGGAEGIVVVNSNNAMIDYNTVKNTDGTAIIVEGTTSETANILDNLIENAGGDGISADGIYDLTITGNEIDIVGGDGIAAYGDYTYGTSAFIDNNEVYDAVDDGIDVEGTETVEISNNVIDGSGDDGIDSDDNLNVTISTNQITDSFDAGITVYGGESVLISGLNEIYDAGADGIRVTDADEVEITGNLIGDQSVSDDIVGVGIYTADNNIVEISGDNQVYNTGLAGIASFNDVDLTIDGNHVENTGAEGIYAEAFDDAEITSNVVVNTESAGIFADGYNDLGYGYSILISGNEVSEAGDIGVGAAYTDDVSIVGNIVEDTDGYGVFTDNSGFVEIDGNSIERTGEHGIAVFNSAYLDLSDNSVTDAGYHSTAGLDLLSTADGVHVESVYGYNGGSGVSPVGVGPYIEIFGDNVINTTEGDGIEVAYHDGLTIDGAQVTGAGENGILLLSDSAVYTGTGDATLSNNVITGSAVNGLYVAGDAHTTVALQGNSFIDNPVGARFESGEIDLSDTSQPNTFENTDPLATPVGMQFDEVGVAGSLSLAGNTFGNTIFTGFTNADSYYIRLEDGSLLSPVSGAPVTLNGLNASYDGFIPATSGGILTQEQLDFIENRLYDADDAPVNGRGQIFVGSTLLLDVEDFFNQFTGFAGGPGAFSVTITALPSVNADGLGGLNANALNALAPDAGGDDIDPNDVAGIEPAAGGEEVSCWSDAASLAGGGTAVNYSFGGSFEDSLSDASGCGS